jgi:hypothetical protein
MFMPIILIGIREVQCKWLKKWVILAEHSQQEKRETESMSKGKKPEAAEHADREIKRKNYVLVKCLARCSAPAYS